MAKKITIANLDQSINNLAVATAKGFEEVFKRFDQNDDDHRHFRARLDVVEKDVSNLRDGYNTLYPQVQRIDDQVQRIDDKLSELVEEVKAIRTALEKVVTREELEKVKIRLARVEKHLGLAIE